MIWQLVQKKNSKRAKGISFGTEKKVKLKDNEYKSSSLVSQIDRKDTKKKIAISKLALQYFKLTEKKVKLKDSMYKSSSLVSQIDRKITKDKSK